MTESASSSCACHGDEKRAQHDPAYRSALTIVVVLNLAFGLCELVGGFIADSQALKADSLDFLGDGSISRCGPSPIGAPMRFAMSIGSTSFATAAGWASRSRRSARSLRSRASLGAIAGKPWQSPLATSPQSRNDWDSSQPFATNWRR